MKVVKLNYDFSLIAVDGGGLRSAAVSVTVFVLDAQDRPPEFEPVEYTVTVQENSTPLSPLVTISVISETPSVQLSIITEEYRDYFAINDSGSLQLVRALDYEMVQEVTVQVNASDGTFYSPVPATVQITIQPENDNRPVFTNPDINASLAENLPQNSLEVSIQATDIDLDSPESPNSHGTVVEYRLLNRSVPFMVVYNSSLRAATLVNTRPLDAELDLTRYTLAVQAYDGLGLAAETPAIVTIRVEDVDDNVPSFDQTAYFATIAEHYTGLLLTVSATDLDRDADLSQISYMLMGTYSSNFTILANGSIFNPVPFDYETDELQYSFTVHIPNCGSRGCNTTVEIMLQDINDHTPQFLPPQYNFTIPVDMFPSVGTIIGRVTAFDGDKGSFVW